MNAIEEGGKTARTFIETIKDPLVLASIATNLALLAYLFYSGHQSLVQRNQYVVETQKILASCLHAEDLERFGRAFRGNQ